MTKPEDEATQREGMADLADGEQVPDATHGVSQTHTPIDEEPKRGNSS